MLNISLLIAIRRDGSLLGVRVIGHRETPGLGDAIEIRRSNWIKMFDVRHWKNSTKEEYVDKTRRRENNPMYDLRTDTLAKAPREKALIVTSLRAWRLCESSSLACQGKPQPPGGSAQTKTFQPPGSGL